MVLWKIDGAAATPDGNLLYWHKPLWVFIVTYCFDDCSNGICW